MSQLFFKGKYLPAIREGRKRTTIRRWGRPRVRAGRQAFTPGLGWLMIEAVDPVTLESLGPDDAQADGFVDVAEMIDALRALYPESAVDGKYWFRVRFRLESEALPTRRVRNKGAGAGLFDSD